VNDACVLYFSKYPTDNLCEPKQPRFTRFVSAQPITAESRYVDSDEVTLDISDQRSLLMRDY
jgi:hypothetical protein